MASLLERYASKIKGVLSCYDRVIIQGTLPALCHAKAMTGYLYAHGIRIFDYAKWAEPLRDALRQHAETLAAAEGVTIEFIRKVKSFRKEDRIKEILAQRGTAPGLVHIFSAMEHCPSYKPWHDKPSGRTFLKPDTAKCLHYYFYFIDAEFGLCYLRVPTWCPFRLQFYFNGHNPLASALRKRGIAFKLVDNAFVELADFTTAQQLADDQRVLPLHRALDRFARRYCPIVAALQARLRSSPVPCRSGGVRARSAGLRASPRARAGTEEANPRRRAAPALFAVGPPSAFLRSPSPRCARPAPIAPRDGQLTAARQPSYPLLGMRRGEVRAHSPLRPQTGSVPDGRILSSSVNLAAYTGYPPSSERTVAAQRDDKDQIRRPMYSN